MKNTRLAYCLAPALLLGLVCFGCKKKAEEKQPEPPPAVTENTSLKVIATVNGDPITLAEFLERFARAGYKSDQEAAREVKEDFLNRLIERKMMLREAQRRRIKVGLPEINKRIDAIREENGKDVKESLAGLSIDFEKWKSDLWEDLMIERLLAREVNRNVSVSPQEIRRYYQANQAEFEMPEQVRVRQIVVFAEEEAQKILDALRNGSADFAAMARQKSTAPESDRGGDLGYFGKGEMPAEFDVVFSLEKGGMSGVVKSPYGFHLFKLEDRRKPRTMTLEEASKSIAQRLTREKADQRYKRWLKELRSRTKFEVNYQALQQ
jgi:peptidyl-prolyl cis-trans isomerase C